MQTLQELLNKNRYWSEEMTRRDPQFFKRLVAQQAPHYLWIGCSDSRVPANEIVGLLPGELFVHRNVANVVIPTDLNCLSVIQYAVDVLKVQHIIVCGHYGCGGVTAAYHDAKLGLITNWLRHIQDVRDKYAAHLDPTKGEGEVLKRLCELNVLEQALHVGQTTIVQAAWERGQQLTIHGFVYGIEDGILHDLAMTVGGADALSRVYAEAVAELWRREA